MFPELIKASCSMFGAWGPAIANISGLGGGRRGGERGRGQCNTLGKSRQGHCMPRADGMTNCPPPTRFFWGLPDTLVQLRALDWGMDSPLNDYPLLVVYHPDAGNGHPFASLTWSGFVGSVTAYGSYMGVSEKVGSGKGEGRGILACVVKS